MTVDNSGNLTTPAIHDPTPISVVFAPKKSQADMDKARDARRRENIYIGRMLFEGRWRQLLIDIDRLTQFNFRKVKDVHDRINALLVKVNFFRQAAIKHADVLFDDAPAVNVPDENAEQKRRWEEISDHCLFESLLHEMATTACAEHVAYLLVKVEDDDTCIETIDGMEVFPVGPLGPGGQPKIVDRRWITRVQDKLDGNKDRYVLRVERHSAGLVENFAYLVSNSTSYDIPANAQPVPLQLIWGEDAPPDRVETGAEYPLIFQFATRLLRREPQPDISKSDLDIIDQAAASMSQLARIVQKHADPKFRVPQDALDPKTGTLKADQDAYIDPDGVMSPIAVEFHIDKVLTFLEKIVNWLLIVLEMSPSILGIKAGAAPESYEKLFLEAANTMSRANRVATTWRPILERLITTALQVDSNLVHPTGYPVAPVSAQFNPGLPRTEGERNRELAEMNIAGQISQITMLQRIHGVNEGQDEFDLLAAEAKAKQAAFGFGNFGPGSGSEPSSGDVPPPASSSLEDQNINNEGGSKLEDVKLSDSDTIGKVPLALQQLALAKERLLKQGDTVIADEIAEKMSDLLSNI